MNELFSEKLEINLSKVDFVKMNQFVDKQEVQYLGNDLLSDDKPYAMFLVNGKYYCAAI